MTFQTIISLGEGCEVAYQLRRHFGTERAGMFDWLILPPRGLGRLLHDGPDELLQLDELEPIDGGNTIVTRRYGIAFHHEFRRGGDGLVKVHRIASQLANVRAKYQALWERLNSDCLAGGPVLFVCSRRREADLDGVGLDDGEALAELRAAAMTRWPGADLRFLFLGYTPWFVADDVTFDQVEGGDPADWRGSDLGWDQMLQRNRVELKSV